MTIYEAKHMFEPATFNLLPQTWLGLGCGSGIFTSASAELLPIGSRVIGIDQSIH